MTLHFLCICRLTLRCILREISTKLRGMLTHLDWSSFTVPGPYFMPIGLFCCPVSTASLRHPSATAFSRFLLPTPLSLTCLSYPTSSLIQDLESKPFVWFRAKTDKGIVYLADHLHSVTYIYIYIYVCVCVSV